MSNYFIKGILLEGCSYSIAANNLIQIHNIPKQITWISPSEKLKYKTEQIDTFPQIYLNKFNTKGNLLLGGYTDLSEFINTFKNQKLNDDSINQFMSKYKWSKKSVLRFIQLINVKNIN
jgi:hypothetical protein